MLILKRGKTNVRYKYLIVPIKIKESLVKELAFVPNWGLLAILKRKSTTPINILDKDFDRYQQEGETIIINENGGWCTLTSADELAN